MLKIRLSALAVTIFSVTTGYSQYTDVINSNRPGESQSAFSVGKTVFQAETGIYGITEKHSLLETKTNGFGFDLSLRYGAFLEQLEFNIDLQYQNDSFETDFSKQTRSALKQTTIGAKYLIYDPHKNYEEKINIHSWKANHRFKWRQFLPAVGVYAGANLNFDSPFSHPEEPNFSPKIMAITQNQFSGGYVLVMNFIADKVGTDFSSYGYVITMTKGFNEKWSGFLENQGFKSDYYSDSILRGGAAYLIKENIQIDASISGNFKDTPSIFYGGVGLSWRFDKKYKPVLIKSGKESKEDKKKEKEKKKKRKDEVELEPVQP